MKEQIKTIGFKIEMSLWQFLRKYAYENETSISGAAKAILKEKMEKENAKEQ